MRLISVLYFVSYALSILGNAVAAVALPLIVLQITGSAFGAGVVAAASAVPAVVVGLVGGVLIDRFNRRTSSVVTDLVSATAVAALPVVDMLLGLDIWWFVVLGIIGTIGDVPGMTAREALLPAVARASGLPLERMIGLREGIGAIALLVGPAAAGTLMVLFDGTTVLWITAATSAGAALVTLAIPGSVGTITRGGEPSGSQWAALRAGWRMFAGNPVLLASTVLGVASLFVLSALQSLILPVYFTDIAQPGLLGFVLSSMALGLLLGSVAFTVLGTRGTRRAWFLVALAGTTAGFVVLALLASPWLVFVGGVVVGSFAGLFNAVVGVATIEQTPDALRGRVLSTQNALVTVAPPIALFTAGALVDGLGTGAAALLVTLVWVVAAATALRPRTLRTLDQREVAVDAQR